MSMETSENTETKIFILIFLLAAAIIGSAYSVVPHLVRFRTLANTGEQYVPLTFKSDADTMSVHGPRYRDVLDGTLFPSETDTYEHKDGPIFWPILSATMLAPFLWVSQSVGGGIILSDLVFPVLIFFSFFLVIYAVTRHRLFSLFSSFILVLFPQVSLSIPPSSLGEAKTLLFNFLPFIDAGVVPDPMYLRREAFIPAGPFFILSFYFIYQSLTRETRRRVFVVLGGVFYGLLFYLYFYFWVFATVFLGILAVFLCALRRWHELRTLMYIAAVGAFVSVPFWVNQFHLLALPGYQELTERMGLETGRGIRWFLWKTYLLFGFFAAGSLWIFKKRGMPIAGAFLASLSFAGIFVLNANVLTGFTPQSDHWATRVFLITNGIILSALAYYFYVHMRSRFSKWVSRDRLVLSSAALILAALLSVNMVHSQIIQAQNGAARFTVPRSLLTAYSWLDKNTPEDSVVVTPAFETNTDVLTYTHNRVFLPRAFTTLASQDEILERLFFVYKLFGMRPEALESALTSKRGVIYLFNARYESKQLDAYLRPERYEHFYLPSGVVQDIAARYLAYVRPLRSPHRADFIFVGPYEQKLGDFKKSFSGYNVVYDADGVVIYQMIQTQ